MRYVLFAIALILFFVSKDYVQNDYMMPKEHPTVLEKLVLDDENDKYVPYGIFMLVDGTEVKLPVTTQFFEKIKVGTKVTVPIRQMNIKSTTRQDILYIFLPVIVFTIVIVANIALFLMSLDRLFKDINQFRTCRRKRNESRNND